MNSYRNRWKSRTAQRIVFDITRIVIPLTALLAIGLTAACLIKAICPFIIGTGFF